MKKIHWTINNSAMIKRAACGHSRNVLAGEPYCGARTGQFKKILQSWREHFYACSKCKAKFEEKYGKQEFVKESE
jgi:hypothetical protein